MDRDRRGFTLVELLVVMAVVAIVARLALPQLLGARNKAIHARVAADLAIFATASTKLYADTGQYPLHLADDPCKASGEALVTDCAVGLFCNDGSYVGWNGPYVEVTLGKDPWARPYYFDADYQEGAATGRAFVSGGPNKSGLNVSDADNEAVFLCSGAGAEPMPPLPAPAPRIRPISPPIAIDPVIE